MALYYLLVFYLATKEACAQYSPVAKFVAVKVVIFATYYQVCRHLRHLLPGVAPCTALSPRPQP